MTENVQPTKEVIKNEKKSKRFKKKGKIKSLINNIFSNLNLKTFKIDIDLDKNNSLKFELGKQKKPKDDN